MAKVLEIKNGKSKVRYYKEANQKKWHFLGLWRNGDPMNVGVYANSRIDAWFKLLKAKKEQKFSYRKGDNFQVFNKCVGDKDVPFGAGGHCHYIVDEDGKVIIN